MFGQGPKFCNLFPKDRPLAIYSLFVTNSLFSSPWLYWLQPDYWPRCLLLKILDKMSIRTYLSVLTFVHIGPVPDWRLLESWNYPGWAIVEPLIPVRPQNSTNWRGQTKGQNVRDLSNPIIFSYAVLSFIYLLLPSRDYVPQNYCANLFVSKL